MNTSRLVNGLHFRNFRGDLFGGLTAAIVALPLALAFGDSSGAGVITGLYGAIFLGFFAALFGGTPSQISGPTGPMTVVMAAVFTKVIAAAPDKDTGMAIAFTIVMLGGLFQVLFGILKLGEYITLIPYTVISGFMSGIGFIILILQIGPFLGNAGVKGVVASLEKFPYFITHVNLAALGLGCLTLLIVFASPARLNRIFPAPLLALIVGTIISLFIAPEMGLLRIGEIPTGLPKPHIPVLYPSLIKDTLGYSLMLATLGAIDSLLTSLVADNITRTQHDSDKELIGQGIGNMIAGFFGGLPGAGATMRTVINVRAGGKTPISGIIHALVLLVIVLGASKLTENIPKAVLAGILIKVGIDIIDWSFLKRAHTISMRATGLMYLVLFLTVFVDLIAAVAVGVFIANMLTVKRLTSLQSDNIKAVTVPHENINFTSEEKHLLKLAKGRILLFHLDGPMSFGAAKYLSQQMSIVEKYDVLILDLSEVPHIGVTATLAIENMVKEAFEEDRSVFLVGVKSTVEDRLRRLKILKLLLIENHYKTRLQALEEGLNLVNVRIRDDVEV
ncbi:MAG: SulP family inorganic anion transporter [Mastigocoleus sp.]